MTLNVAMFIWQYIYFCDNEEQKVKSEHGYDTLFKVKYALNAVQKGLLIAWVAGQHVIIDKNMMK